MFDKAQPSYIRFRDLYAERTASIVAWVGAGLSVPAGLPTWAGLRRKLEAEATMKARTLDGTEQERAMSRIEKLRAIRDPWTAFERLKDVLGIASYRAGIRDALSPRAETTVPENYRRLCRMRLAGILNLNIDRLASRGMTEVKPGALVYEFSGREVATRLHLLKSPHPFIANLHGIFEDYSSWVFTKTEMQSLLELEEYQLFIKTIITTKTLLFIGISADDVASGGFIGNLVERGFDTGQHFWLTNRTDEATDNWAENNGIQIIRYTDTDGRHSDLEEFLGDLVAYVPRDSVPPPIAPEISDDASVALPAPSALAALPPEEIRHILNARASVILNSGSLTTEKLREYEDFCLQYEQAIHNAWFINQREPSNIFFGYRVNGKIGDGAFGRVYKAVDSQGRPVAIKLLRFEVRESKDMLGSFRRGVRSMRILSDNNVEGMVPLRAAYELPACIVMELIDGPNLQTAVESRQLQFGDKLKIVSDIVRIIRKGHNLPQRVLHRDIRPPNIMLRNFYRATEQLPWDIIVLDFDLSWHRDASEKSIDISAVAALGYLAPEQLQESTNASTRNALVDSYGIGMTIYYVFTENHPKPGDARRTDWYSIVSGHLKRSLKYEWKSLPNRLARLIVASTRFEQSLRLDLSEIAHEVDRIKMCHDSPNEIPYAELWCEELLCRVFGSKKDDYTWDTERMVGSATLAGGMQWTLSSNEVDRNIALDLRWASSGQEEWKRVNKYLPKAVERAVSLLKGSGWSINSKDIGAGGSFVVMATIKVEDLRKHHNRVISGMKDTVSALSF